MWVEFPSCSYYLSDDLWYYDLTDGTGQVVFRVTDGKIETVGHGNGIGQNKFEAQQFWQECQTGTTYKTEWKPLYAFCAGCAIILMIYIIWKMMLEKVVGK